MESKKRLAVYLDTACIEVFKLDALLSRSTVSARVREVLEAHARKLHATQPCSLVEARKQYEVPR
jgi:hypothetical protein